MISRWALGLAVVSIVGVVPTAAASAPSGGRYCVANAVTGESTCASRADVALARQSVGVAAPSATGSEGELVADVLVGRLYTALNYGGDIYEIYFSSACNTASAVDWQLASLPSWINDETSSFRGYANCRLQIWVDANFGGASYGPLASSSYVGATMNDKASSVKGS